MILSARELGVLKLLAAGFTSEQIANLFGVTQRTMRAELESICRKLETGASEINTAGHSMAAGAHRLPGVAHLEM